MSGIDGFCSTLVDGSRRIEMAQRGAPSTSVRQTFLPVWSHGGKEGQEFALAPSDTRARMIALWMSTRQCTSRG